MPACFGTRISFSLMHAEFIFVGGLPELIGSQVFDQLGVWPSGWGIRAGARASRIKQEPACPVGRARGFRVSRLIRVGPQAMAIRGTRKRKPWATGAARPGRSKTGGCPSVEGGADAHASARLRDPLLDAIRSGYAASSEEKRQVKIRTQPENPGFRVPIFSCCRHSLNQVVEIGQHILPQPENVLQGCPNVVGYPVFEYPEIATGCPEDVILEVDEKRNARPPSPGSTQKPDPEASPFSTPRGKKPYDRQETSPAGALEIRIDQGQPQKEGTQEGAGSLCDAFPAPAQKSRKAPRLKKPSGYLAHRTAGQDNEHWEGGHQKSRQASLQERFTEHELTPAQTSRMVAKPKTQLVRKGAFTGDPRPAIRKAASEGCSRVGSEGDGTHRPHESRKCSSLSQRNGCRPCTRWRPAWGPAQRNGVWE